MKQILLKILFSLCCLATIIGGLAASATKFPTDNTNATAESKDGYIIFFYSKPGTAYDTLGEVKNKFSISGSPAELFEQILKKVKKDFPKADAIIFNGVEMEKATAIKFK